MYSCNQTLNMSSSSLSIIYTPSTYLSCCNITLSSDSSEQIMINIFNLSMINPTLKIYNKQFEIIKFYNSSSSDRTYFKTDVLNLPIIFSLCQFNITSFEILITNISKGNKIYIKKNNFLKFLSFKQNQYQGQLLKKSNELFEVELLQQLLS